LGGWLCLRFPPPPPPRVPNGGELCFLWGGGVFFRRSAARLFFWSPEGPAPEHAGVGVFPPGAGPARLGPVCVLARAPLCPGALALQNFVGLGGGGCPGGKRSCGPLAMPRPRALMVLVGCSGHACRDPRARGKPRPGKIGWGFALSVFFSKFIGFPLLFPLSGRPTDRPPHPHAGGGPAALILLAPPPPRPRQPHGSHVPVGPLGFSAAAPPGGTTFCPECSYILSEPPLLVPRTLPSPTGFAVC